MCTWLERKEKLFRFATYLSGYLAYLTPQLNDQPKIENAQRSLSQQPQASVHAQLHRSPQTIQQLSSLTEFDSTRRTRKLWTLVLQLTLRMRRQPG